MKPKVSIITPVHDKNDKTIYETINALENQTYAGKKEIILVNDGDFDLDKSILKSKDIIYKRVEPCTRAKARNIGISLASGEVICFTDSDCIPDKDWINEIMNEFNESEKTGIALGPIVCKSSNVFVKAEHLCWAHELSASGKKEKRKLASTANMAVKASILNKINFDESLAGSEDSDLSMKVYKEGYDIIFNPKISVLHLPKRGTLKSFVKHWYNYGVWTIKFINIHRKDVPYNYVFPKNKLLLFLSSFITVPLSTVKIIYNNSKHNKKSIFYFPLVFLARTAWALGALKR